jgi:hypothetical protein
MVFSPHMWLQSEVVRLREYSRSHRVWVARPEALRRAWGVGKGFALVPKLRFGTPFREALLRVTVLAAGIAKRSFVEMRSEAELRNEGARGANEEI